MLGDLGAIDAVMMIHSASEDRNPKGEEVKRHAGGRMDEGEEEEVD